MDDEPELVELEDEELEIAELADDELAYMSNEITTNYHDKFQFFLGKR